MNFVVFMGNWSIYKAFKSFTMFTRTQLSRAA
jgi:hypothetical protein